MSNSKSATELELKKILERIRKIEEILKQNGISPSNDLNSLESVLLNDAEHNNTSASAESARELLNEISSYTQQIAELDEQIELLQNRYEQVELAHSTSKQSENYSKLHELFEFVADEYWMNKNLYLLNRQKLILQIKLSQKEEALAKIQMQ